LRNRNGEIGEVSVGTVPAKVSWRREGMWNVGMDKNVVFKYYITAIKKMCYLNKVIKVNYY
jgi:hypothetical protein